VNSPRYGGDYARAISLKRRGLGVARSIGDELQVATLLDDITPLLAATGDFAEAHACIDEALPIRRAHAEEDPLGVPHTLAASAGLALSEGHPAAAASLVAQIAECERTMEPHPDWILESTWLKARTLLANGAETQAVALFGRLVREAGAVTFLWPIIDSLNALARLAAEADPQRAARLIGMADRIQAESRLATWDPVEREHTVSSLRDRLGERTLERLRAAGHALPINAMAAAVEEGAY
jgi:hypothetical protein